MNKKLKQKIIQMKNIDQKMRFACNPKKLTVKNYMVFLTDMVNNDLIKGVIKAYGYPLQKLIGKEGMKAFWLLIQHQDKDVELQKKCLKNCDFEPKEKAFLTDRILLNQNKKQIYGTQFNCKIKDEKNVNKCREKMGLELLKEYLNK